MKKPLDHVLDLMKKPLDHVLDQLDELLLVTNHHEQTRAILDIRRILLKIKRDSEFIPGVDMDLPPISDDMRKDKKWTSIDVSCPTCKAKPGSKCVKMSKRGQFGTPTDEPIDKYHVPRRERAKARNS